LSRSTKLNFAAGPIRHPAFAGTLLARGEFLQRKQSVTALNNT
jgi:hypothetical protein